MWVRVFLAFSFLSVTVRAIQDMQLDVVDQNFNSSNKIVISEQEIKQSHATNLADLLSSQANINIVSTNFQPNSIFLRGGDSSHVLILIDGVPNYDPSTLQRTVNLGNMNLKSIKKIEVIKGSQSVIYGGQALSGVIKIETFPQPIMNQTVASAQSGFNITEGAISHLNAVDDNKAISINVRSAAYENKSPAENSNKKYFQNTENIDATILIKHDFESLIRLNYSNDRNEIATTSPTYKALDTNNFKMNTESSGLSYILRKNNLIQFSMAYQASSRTFLQSANDDLIYNAATERDYKGQLFASQLDFRLIDIDILKFNLGLNYKQEKVLYIDLYPQNPSSGEFDGTVQAEGAYLKTDWSIGKSAVLEAGVRAETNKFRKIDGINDIYQIGLTIKKHFKIERSTGFNAPSISQLFSSYGNLNLKPEKAQTNSVSYESKFSENLQASITAFDVQFENLMVTTGNPPVYQNIASTRTQGIEVYANYQNPGAYLNYIISAGYQEPKDLSANNWLIRRPLRTASLKISSQMTDNFDISTEVRHTGDRLDKTGSTSYVTVDPYTLIHLMLDYKVNNVNTFIRINNILGTKYQPFYGFYNKDPEFKLGAEIQF